MPSLDELVARLRASDRSAVYEYASMRRNRLLAYIQGQLAQSLWGKVDPLDLFQETLIAAWKYLPQTDLRDRDPFGWMCDLAHEKIVDVARRFAAQKRDIDIEQHLSSSVAGQQTTPSMNVARKEEQQEVLNAVKQLPEPAREAIRLRYTEGLPTEQIAQRMGKSDGAIRVLLSRALATLRQALGADESNNPEKAL